MSLPIAFATAALVTATAVSAVPKNRFFGQTKTRLSQKENQKIKHLLSESDYEKMNKQPEYQRGISWSESMMCDFILSVLLGRTILPILLYQYQPGEDTSGNGYTSEVIDGQHRLFALNAFINASWTYLSKEDELTDGKKVLVHLPPIEEDGIYKYIFYKKTEDTEEWGRDNKHTVEYLSDGDKQLFDNTNIITITIISPLTMNERIEDFLSLQKGRPVRNSDLLKNEYECGITVHFKTHDYKTKMSKLINHCTTKPKKFYINWGVRCFWLFLRATKNNTLALELNDESSISSFDKKYPNPEDIFVITDPAIGKMITKHDPILNVSEDDFNAFNTKFDQILQILNHFEGAMFNRTQLFAVFYHLCDDKYNHEYLRGYMTEFSKSGKEPELKKLWESSKKEPRIRYYNQCLAELRDMLDPAVYETRQITPKIKKQVWDKCKDGKCVICKQNGITEKVFHVGHIKARARRGSIEIDNLLPMCSSCNHRMGTRNAYEFQKDEYPDAAREREREIEL
jgi:hypothetical protein